MPERLKYLIIFFVLLAVEICIALFVHDQYIRPYGGDVIVVWVIYCFVQILLGGKYNHYFVALGVLLFAYIVEILQKMNIVEVLGLGNIRFIKILIGTTFSISDLICYTAGTIATIAGIWLYKKVHPGDRLEKG